MAVNKDFVYDIECYPNYFCIGIEELHGNTKVLYEISEWVNERSKLLKLLIWFKKKRKRMIGFNSLSYDYPVIHYLIHQTNKGMTGAQCAKALHWKGSQIIDTSYEDRFKNMVWEKDRFVKQIDLYRVHHFDNAGVGLKELEFNMRLDKIQDLPIKPNTIVTREQSIALGDYCLNSDVSATKKFAEHTEAKVIFREKLKKDFPKVTLNDSDAKIGSNIVIQELEDRLGDGTCYEYVKGERKPRGTFRSKIVLKDIIFDYIEFDRPEFKALLNFLKGQVIMETKGAFNDIPFDVLGELGQYSGEIAHNKKLDTYHVKKLNVIVDGFQFDIGTGGIHGSVSSQVIVSDKEYVILDLDVKGFYPEVAVKNGLHPKHLTHEFVPVYEIIIDKKDKALPDTLEKAAYKLAGNASYGNSNSVYSPLYDPQFTMSITINGQLLLCMLSEKLMEIPSLTMIQANTDGVTVRLKRSEVDQLNQVWNNWEEMSNLVLEENTYSRMMIANVNNYIAEYDKEVHGEAKLKLKGKYASDLQWNQDFSNLISRKAAVEFLVHGVDIDWFIKDHFHKTKNGHPKNIHDFMLRAKISRTHELIAATDILDHEDETLGDTYKSLDIQSRLILEEKGYESFERAHKELVETGLCTPTKTIKSHCEMGVYLDIKPKVAKAGYMVYLEQDHFPVTTTREKQQRITRYFVSNEGVRLFKLMPPLIEKGKTSTRYSSIEAGQDVTEVNNMRLIDYDEINFQWYVDEALKLVEPLLGLTDEKPKKVVVPKITKKDVPCEVIDLRHPKPVEKEKTDPPWDVDEKIYDINWNGVDGFKNPNSIEVESVKPKRTRSRRRKVAV